MTPGSGSFVTGSGNQGNRSFGRKPASLAKRGSLCALRAQRGVNQVVLDSPDPEEPGPASAGAGSGSSESPDPAPPSPDPAHFSQKCRLGPPEPGRSRIR